MTPSERLCIPYLFANVLYAGWRAGQSPPAGLVRLARGLLEGCWGAEPAAGGVNVERFAGGGGGWWWCGGWGGWGGGGGGGGPPPRQVEITEGAGMNYTVRPARTSDVR